jgi:hypothetical protein
MRAAGQRWTLTREEVNKDMDKDLLSTVAADCTGEALSMLERGGDIEAVKHILRRAHVAIVAVDTSIRQIEYRFKVGPEAPLNRHHLRMVRDYEDIAKAATDGYQKAA